MLNSEPVFVLGPDRGGFGAVDYESDYEADYDGEENSIGVGVGVGIGMCAVTRLHRPVGAKPTRPLSLRPVAVGAVVEAMKRLEPSM